MVGEKKHTRVVSPSSQLVFVWAGDYEKDEKTKEKKKTHEIRSAEVFLPFWPEISPKARCTVFSRVRPEKRVLTAPQSFKKKERKQRLFHKCNHYMLFVSHCAQMLPNKHGKSNACTRPITWSITQRICCSIFSWRQAQTHFFLLDAKKSFIFFSAAAVWIFMTEILRSRFSDSCFTALRILMTMSAFSKTDRKEKNCAP